MLWLLFLALFLLIVGQTLGIVVAVWEIMDRC
jgi:hypothetical protein